MALCLGEVEIFGCGGETMREAGVETIADLRKIKEDRCHEIPCLLRAWV
jgi:hypothetical protein